MSGQDYSVTEYSRVRIAHAVTGTMAWVIILPLGSIVMALSRSRAALYIHAAVQLFGLAIFTINVGAGIWMALVSAQALNEYHPAIGLLIFALAWTQPLSGLVHHAQYAKRHGRTLVSYAHIWLGRALVTLGIIEGGLGLLFSSDGSRADYVAYGVVAAVVWSAWVVVSVFGSRGNGKTTAVKA